MIILDPLSCEADPRLYVPLDTGERALAEISASLENRFPVLLTGPAGVGKTVLLMVLAERERNTYSRVRFARSLPSQAGEMTGWLLRLLFGKTSVDGANAEPMLHGLLHELNGQPLLLLVDEIHRAPDACVQKLTDLALVNPGRLVVVAAGTPGPDLEQRRATLNPELVVALPDTLPLPELEKLYDAILAHPGLSPRLHARMASVVRAEILDAAFGSPRLLKEELLRRDHERLPRSLPPPDKPRPKPEQIPPTQPIARPPAMARPPVFTPPPITPPPIAPPQIAKPLAVPRPVALEAPRARPPRPRIGRARAQLAMPFVAVARATVRLLASLARGCAYLIALPGRLVMGVLRLIGAFARGVAALFVGALRALGRLGWAIVSPVVAALRAAGSALARAGAYVARAPGALANAVSNVARAIADAIRATVHALLTAILAACRYVLALPLRIGRAARDALLAGARRSADLVRSALAAFQRGGARLARPISSGTRAGVTRLKSGGVTVLRGASNATAALDARLAHAAGRARAQLASTRHKGALAVARSETLARRTGAQLAHARHASAVALGRSGSAARRTARVAVLPATAVAAVALLLVIGEKSVVRENPPVAAAPPRATAPAPVESPAIDRPAVESSAVESAAAPQVNLQVNARPWARVRIDGVDLGATPLSRSMAPGSYQLEAEFPDGRKIQRRIDVDPERRFVSLP